MFNKFTSLQFIIGIFFTILSIILAGGYYLSENLRKPINLYSAIFFIIFGVLMMMGKAEKED